MPSQPVLIISQSASERFDTGRYQRRQQRGRREYNSGHLDRLILRGLSDSFSLFSGTRAQVDGKCSLNMACPTGMPFLREDPWSMDARCMQSTCPMHTSRMQKSKLVASGRTKGCRSQDMVSPENANLASHTDASRCALVRDNWPRSDQ